MKNVVKLKESDLHKIINSVIRSVLNEEESYGWTVETWEAEKAYDFFAQELGNEDADRAIVRAMSNEELAKVLAYLFRKYNLTGWEDYRQSENN